MQMHRGGYFMPDIGWEMIPALGNDAFKLEVIGNIYEDPELSNG